MAVSAYVQDPHAIRNYGIDWLLDSGDTITTSTWTRFADDGVTATTEITIGTTSFINSPAPKTIVQLSYPAPVVGKTHLVVNQVTTAQGKRENHTLIILCQEE